MKIYTVKKGDTLSGIAAKHGVTVQDLLQYNPGIQNPDVIDVGMKIKIPASKTPAPAGDWVHQHKVVQGDTLWKLSKAWGVPLADLIKANPQLKNPNVLMTGEIINIPKPGWQAGGHGTGYPQDLQHVGVESPVPGKAFTGVMPGKKPTAPIEQPKPIDLSDLPAAPKMEAPKPIIQPKEAEMPKTAEKPVDWTKLPKPVPLPVPEPIHPPVKPYGHCPEPHHPGYPVQPLHAGWPDHHAKHPFQQIQIPAIEAFAQPWAVAGAGYPPAVAAPGCDAGYGHGMDPVWSGHGYEWPVQAAVGGQPGWPGLAAYASAGMPHAGGHGAFPWPPGWPAPYPHGIGDLPGAGYREDAAPEDPGTSGGEDGLAEISGTEARAEAKTERRGKAKKASVRAVSGRGSRRPKQQAPKRHSGLPWINNR